MASGRSNISRSVWRFFEIALFFAVSVVGFSMYAKTATFNAKQKSRAQQQQGSGCPAELYSISLTLFHSPFQHAVPFTGKASSHDSAAATGLEFQHASHLCVIAYPHHSSVFISDIPSSPVFTAFPRNLLQQNPVLLI
ncbi:MAG: hypothetical protein FJY09_06330 [Chlorobi bacterium]|nr:hypothetical protein [Chlorobiota bacterium]